jgi:signal transduction histidine kinase
MKAFVLIRLRFASLRRRLLAAFIGVLFLSLALTAAIFWLQIRVYDVQQVQSDLGTSAPTVLTGVKQRLESYWQTNLPEAKLRTQLAGVARASGVRVILTDFCNHVAIDTAYSGDLVALPKTRVLPNCSADLADPAAASGQPHSIFLEPGGDLVRQTGSLPGGGTWYYRAYIAPTFQPYAPLQGQSLPLQARTIIITKSPGAVEQDALGNVLPKLAAAGIFAVALTLVVVVLLVGAIIRPLRMITAASERMARGDYDQRVPETGADEVGQLARSFNRMAGEVNNAREMQRRFLANVSHDLKTPLTSILGFSQILVEESAGPTQQRAAQVINEEARRLQRLTLDLLELSRLESGRLQLRRTILDLNDLAGRALAPYAELPANAALHFLDQRASGPLWISGDGDRLMQALVNLLDNAVKFCDPKGSVALGTERRGTAAVLTVANTGVAIDPEDITRVFQRFYRTDHSRATRTGGTGLGLAIVREVVAAHGGQIEARSDDDGWTRFVMSLPSASEGAARQAAQGTSETSPTPRPTVEQGSPAPEIPV